MARKVRPATISPISTSTHREPCASCGEESAVGSVFYSDRLVIDDETGHRTFLCNLCEERIRASRKGTRLTDDEVLSFIRNGTMTAMAWSGMAH
jgi:hypothetical protein